MPFISYTLPKRNMSFNFRLVARMLGLLLIVLAVSMILPMAVSLVTRDGMFREFLLSSGSLLALGYFARNVLGWKAPSELRERESFWITGVTWIVVPLVGTIPYLVTGAFSNFTDAAFESFSGFTTTGSSVMLDLDSLSPSLLVWRSLTQWIGGLGFMLFIVAFYKGSTSGLAKLYEAEFSGTIQRKLHPHISKSVSRMWYVYGLLTVTLFVLLLLLGNDFVESFCLSVSTVSTGGFMPHSDGLSQFSDSTIVVVTIFMFLAGVNLALLYNLFSGKFGGLLHDEEFHLYLLLFLLASALATGAFVKAGHPLSSSALYAFFHIASTISTCGFSMPDFQGWPMLLSVITFVLIFIGASAGSTGGGIKLKRIMLMFKYVKNYFVRMLHPNAVLCVKLGKQVIPTDYIAKIFAFVFLYLSFCVGGAFILTLCGINIPNAVCMAAANIGNLGPSPLLNNIGGSCDYSLLPIVGKWTLMMLMLVGRIEIFAFMAILSPAYWRR